MADGAQRTGRGAGRPADGLRIRVAVAEGDTVVENNGARVFVDESANIALGDRVGPVD